MGAFDGLIPNQYNLPQRSYADSSYKYFQTQSAFNFYDGFGLNELKLLVEDAEDKKEDIVWIPVEGRCGSGVGISTWYARVILDRELNNN